MNNFNYNNLTPFKWFVLENFPFIENDFDAINNYHLFSKVVEYLNKTIDNVNVLGNLVEQFSNYFDNLDVQDEINQKLDEMAEDGTLQEIITAYLNVKGILAFNTVLDMKNATNIVDGSFVKTYGNLTYNDGKGEFYKIREVTNEDVIDGINIIAITNNNQLVAELMENYTIEKILNPYFVVCGDSWSDGNNDQDPWVARVAEYNNMTAINKAVAGTGFATGSTTFAQQVLNAKTYCDNNNIDVKNVKYIIAYGGVNDYRNGRTIQEVNTGFDTFMVNAHTNFPNSKIIVIFSNTGLFNTWDTVEITDPNARSSYQDFPEWNEEITSHMRTGGHCQVVSDAYLWLNVYGQDSTNNVFKADRLHPQAIGQRVISQYMLQILNGSYSGVHKMLGCGILENSTNSNIKLTYNISLVGNQIILTGKIPLQSLNYTPATNTNLDFTVLGPSKRLFTMANLFNEMTVKVTDFSQNHPNSSTTGDVKSYLQLSSGRLRIYLTGGERYGDLFMFGATSIG